ncbi:MAG: mechanosensitive ion channel family protein [Candidatus Marinimicrobia bacterium]|nr:mechanosensitive ion channel family protein [Candidatus Neomarinimicrobiota bacterium]
MQTPIQYWLNQYPTIGPYVGLAVAVAVAWAAFLATRLIINRALKRLITRSSTQLDDMLFDHSVFSRLSLMVPALILYNFAYLLPFYSGAVRQLITAGIAGIMVISVGATLSAIGDYLEHSGYGKRFGVKSYIQLAKLILYISGALVIVAILIGRSPWVLISGLGALTAVLLLVFRDTILSFVASLQISSNNLVQVGDWIEMPAFGADGDVIDIALHTIKVQNWDKTVTVIPTAKLIDGSFKNWRAMSQSGGRRIKRAIYLDMSFIKLCDEKTLDRFERIDLLGPYINRKRSEVSAYNSEHNIDDELLINGRRLTNLGTFRAYIEAYLRHHPDIHQEMTLLVRQLDPGPDGLPIEVYAFTSDTNWARYEGIQADIFDHLLAVLPQFDLQVFQHPTGSDFKALINPPV